MRGCLYTKSLLCFPELQFLVEHHLYRQQQGGDECSSESCLSDRPSPDAVPAGEELPEDEEGWSTGDKATSEAFEKLRCQMEGEETKGEEKKEEQKEREERERGE